MTRRRWVNLDWRVATWAGIGLYVAFTLVYLFLGQLNDDEGWYLFASKLVFQGRIPHRDFAFTQMPLLPYIYGLPQVILPRSILLGRITSVAFSVANLFLSLSLGRRYAGERGAGLAALLLGSFTYGIYFLSIVKTYSFISFTFTLTLWILSSDMPELYRYPIAIVLGFLAAMTRLSAVMFLIPVVLYGLIAPRSRGTFVVVVMLLGVLGLSTAMFFLPHLDRLLWNVPNYHARRWNDVSVMSTIAETLAIGIPDLIQFFDIYIFLLLPATLLALCEKDVMATIRSYVSHNPPLLVVGIGLALFAVSHLAAGGWHIEYFGAAVVSSLPIIAIVFHKMHDLQESSAAKVLLWGALLTALLVAPARHGVQHISIPGRQLTLHDVSEVSALIARHSDPSDRVLALQALWAVIGSNRSVLPGLTMSQFSYHDVSREEAQRFGVVNGEIVLEYVSSCAARVIVLTDLDWELFTRTGYDQSIRQALFDRYELVLNKGLLGQQPWNLEVYACAAGDG